MASYLTTPSPKQCCFIVIWTFRNKPERVLIQMQQFLSNSIDLGMSTIKSRSFCPDATECHGLYKKAPLCCPRTPIDSCIFNNSHSYFDWSFVTIGSFSPSGKRSCHQIFFWTPGEWGSKWLYRSNMVPSHFRGPMLTYYQLNPKGQMHNEMWSATWRIFHWSPILIDSTTCIGRTCWT